MSKRKKGKKKTEVAALNMDDVLDLMMGAIIDRAVDAAVANPATLTKMTQELAAALIQNLDKCRCPECLRFASSWATEGRALLNGPDEAMAHLSDPQRAAVGAALDQLESAVAHAAGAD